MPKKPKRKKKAPAKKKPVKSVKAKKKVKKPHTPESRAFVEKRIDLRGAAEDAALEAAILNVQPLSPSMDRRKLNKKRCLRCGCRLRIGNNRAYCTPCDDAMMFGGFSSKSAKEIEADRSYTSLLARKETV